MKRKTKVWLLCILTFALFSVLPIKPAHADTPGPLEIVLDKPFYYIKGETMHIQALCNSSVSVTLNVYWNWKTFNDNELVYSSTKTTNATWDLPTGSQKVGFYRLEALSGERRITVERTLVGLTGYSSASLPFSYEWKGIFYTFDGTSLNATFQDDYITITYPKIPYSFSATLYYNNMTFIIRLVGSGWAVDITYMLVHSGVKWILNGTVPASQTFDFQCSNNPSKVWTEAVHEFKSMNTYLTFSWMDLVIEDHSFAYNSLTQVLTVTIPDDGPFNIDPYIFEDGFESGDLSAWTGNTTTAGETMAVVSSEKHHGTYSLNCTDDGSDWGECAYAYKNFASPYYADIFARAYVKFTAWGSMGFAGRTYYPLGLCGENTENIVGMVELTSTGKNWSNRYRNGTVVTTVTTNTVATLNTWICIEMRVYVHNTDGCVTLWVDGVMASNVTNIDTNNYGNVGRVKVGMENNGWIGEVDGLLVDCVVVDTSYIGVEASNNAPTIGSFQGPTTMYANTYDFVNVTVNDADLVADFENCTIQLNGTIQLLWVNSTNTFSEASDASGYCTLNASACVKTTVNTTALTLAWHVKLTWTYPEGSVWGNGTVFDGDGSATGNGTVFTFEDDLIVATVTHHPPNPGDGQTFTVSGTLYYQGTIIVPQDGTGIVVRLERMGFVVASDTSIGSDGAYSISHSEVEPGDYSYTVYAITDAVSTQNLTERVVVEKTGTGGPGYNPPDDTDQSDTAGATEAADTGGVGDQAGGPPSSLSVNPLVVGGIIVIAIILVAAYTSEPTLKKSRSQWKKEKEKKPKKWKKSGKPFQ